jgi:hypothetical protein
MSSTDTGIDNVVVIPVLTPDFGKRTCDIKIVPLRRTTFPGVVIIPSFDTLPRNPLCIPPPPGAGPIVRPEFIGHRNNISPAHPGNFAMRRSAVHDEDVTKIRKAQ